MTTEEYARLVGEKLQRILDGKLRQAQPNVPYDLSDPEDLDAFRLAVRAHTGGMARDDLVAIATLWGYPVARNSSKEDARRVMRDAWLNFQRTR